MRRLLTVLAVCFLLLCGCEKEKEIPYAEMPEDFAFHFTFGIGGWEELNTYYGYLVKDLVENGRRDAAITVSREDLQEIYNHFSAYGIGNLSGEYYPENVDLKPKALYTFSYTVNGETRTVVSDGTIELGVNTTDEMDDLAAFFRYLSAYVRQTDVYRSLPEPVGAYE